ncbi:hypothetical protein [Candidatus Pelagibacter bacterium nBUS_25]|uniref:hypothetical protein n=1 Tax=Candidatus Pelagibacter bacterium nBUS_25 TaxID=3374187 RepID=UPI003EC07E74
MLSFFKSIYSIIKINKLNSIWKKRVFFSENESYSSHLRPLVNEFLKNRKKILYVTSQINDPIFNIKDENLTALYISPVLGQILFFNFLNCEKLFLTMPDINNFHLKKSKNCKSYIYIFHSPVSTNMIYRDKAFFNYDEYLCVGNHHIEELSEYIEKYSLKNKKLHKTGYFKLDEIYKNKNSVNMIKKKKILIAPSWGKINIINLCGEKLISKLLESNYEVILRPHIQSLKYDGKLLKIIENNFKNFHKFKIQKENFSFNDFETCEFLITDWSGIGMEYAFAFERPVIYINTPKKIMNKNFNDISTVPLEDKIRDKIGLIIEPEQIENITSIMNCTDVNDQSFKNAIIKCREKFIYNFKNSALEAYKLFAGQN